MVHTSVNIHKKYFNQLKEASDITGESVSSIIIRLLKLVMDDDTLKSRIERSVTYQERDNSSNWHNFHLRLRNDDYEFFTDMRNFLKFSVSFLIGFAVKKYLKKIINKIDCY